MDPVQARRTATRSIFWAAVWLASVLIAVKAYYLTRPGAIPWVEAEDRSVRLLAAISYADVLFAAGLWLCARAALLLAGDRRLLARLIAVTFVAFAALACLYAVANVIFYGVLGGFFTYQLLALVGDVGMLRSSVSASLTPRIVLGLVCLPLAYAALVWITVAGVRRWRGAGQAGHRWVAFACLCIWVTFGRYAYTADWATRQERGIAENPHWLLMSSWWHAVSGGWAVSMTEPFAAADLADFEPIGRRLPVHPAVVLTRSSPSRGTRAAPAERPLNVIVVVLESVAARWTSLNGGPYSTTPNLVAESRRALVFDNFYAHIGRSSNSLVAMLLSAYPKLDFRDVTEQYPRLPGTSLAEVFRESGYRTAFVTPSNLSWADWGTFLDRRGFGELRDADDLTCGPPISSWGVEDRCMVDGMLEFINRAPTRPFFLMAWTTQTHHPYEPTPGIPILNLSREPVPDAYDLGRYLNVLHETDRQLGRLFDTLRSTALDQNTLVVVTGDHGQAFGYPHDTYAQGRTVYEEDVHVPLMFWFPRVYRSMTRSDVVGGHVDLAPTIAQLAGLPAAPDWQGRSLFETGRDPRAYFYVAGDRFELGVREGNWKFILDLREGVEQLYDLHRDPTEQQNVAAKYPDRCARLRQRLAAWTDANRRQYASASIAGT
jgi:lipoteichoic acid synthase